MMIYSILGLVNLAKYTLVASANTQINTDTLQVQVCLILTWPIIMYTCT